VHAFSRPKLSIVYDMYDKLVTLISLSFVCKKYTHFISSYVFSPNMFIIILLNSLFPKFVTNVLKPKLTSSTIDNTFIISPNSQLSLLIFLLTLPLPLLLLTLLLPFPLLLPEVETFLILLRILTIFLRLFFT